MHKCRGGHPRQLFAGLECPHQRQRGHEDPPRNDPIGRPIERVTEPIRSPPARGGRDQPSEPDLTAVGTVAIGGGNGREGLAGVGAVDIAGRDWPARYAKKSLSTASWPGFGSAKMSSTGSGRVHQNSPGKRRRRKARSCLMRRASSADGIAWYCSRKPATSTADKSRAAYSRYGCGTRPRRMVTFAGRGNRTVHGREWASSHAAMFIASARGDHHRSSQAGIRTDRILRGAGRGQAQRP